MLAADHFGTDDARAPLVLLHGMSYDRRQWGPVVEELATIDPGRRIVAFDLPGHGGSPRSASYRGDEVVELLHKSVEDAGVVSPVLVGHSLGAVLATRYAATHPTHGVVNIDQPLLVGPFAEFLRSVEPVLRSPDYLQIWDRLRAGMQIELLPPTAQDLVRTATTPRQDLFLGYWEELFDPAIDEAGHIRRDLARIHDASVPYHYVGGSDPSPEFIQWLTAAVPDVTVTVLPEGGHFPHLAHPDAVARLVAAHV